MPGAGLSGPILNHHPGLLRRGPLWTPESPTGDGGLSPAHWYRSDGAYTDAGRTTPVANDGDVVGSWTDLTANADHVSQATAGNKPTWQNGAGDQLNGHPVLRFDGTDDWLEGAFSTGGAMSQPMTILVVAALGAAAVNDGTRRYLFTDDDSEDTWARVREDGTPDKWGVYAGGPLTGNNTNSNWNIWTILFNGVSSHFWHNGLSELGGLAGANGMSGLHVGSYHSTSASPWLGDVTEIIMYGAGLSNADNNQLGRYMAVRYGLSYTDIT